MKARYAIVGILCGIMVHFAGCAEDALSIGGSSDGPLPDQSVVDLSGRVDALGADASGREMGFSCTPGATFCSGSQIWQCTFLGNDAHLVTDCGTQEVGVGNSPTNPFVCATDHCEGGVEHAPGPACCRNGVPLCVASVTSTTFPSLTFWGPDAPNVVPCLMGYSVPGNVNVLELNDVTQGGDTATALIYLPPNLIAVGQTVDFATFLAKDTMPVRSTFTVTIGGKVCDAWTGSISFLAAAPHYHVVLNVQCSAGALVGTKFAADISGQL